jgi:formylglycine-generating enzyme required for sulfatase activity
MGLVFVLLPGGDFLFGAQANDPTGLHYDPSARSHEGPPEPVRLAPFFLSKFEMTQAQWTRVTGRNPSYWADGDRIGDFAFGPLTPIESITWSEGVEVLARLDLTLPTESQWEYAARGDTHSVWWSGDTADGIGAVANLTGRGDGFQLHAPIGSFPPNPFGLHEILGNLSEWCLDVFKVECRDWPLRAGDGQRETPDGPERVIRGGSSTSAPTYATCARRDDNLFYEGHRITTVRPALGLRGRNARLVPTGGSH